MDTQELRQTVYDFLKRHRKAVFATVDADGAPHTSLMLYVVDEDLNIYFGTRKAFNKYHQLCARPKMSLSVIEETIDPLQVVDVHGEAVEVPAEEKMERFAFFKENNPSIYYVEDAEDYVMFKIKPSGIRWLDATSGELQITPLEV
jgi:general stress protein 26